MELKSRSCSQQTAKCTYAKPNKSCQCHPILLLWHPFQYYPPIYEQVSKVVSYPSSFPTKILYKLVFSHTCHLPCTSNFPDLITQLTSGDERKSWRCPSCDFLHPAISSSLSGPNTYLSIYITYQTTWILELLYTPHYWHFALLTIHLVVIFNKTMC